MNATLRVVESRAGLVQEEVTVEIRSAVERCILIAVVLDAFGALLCVFSMYVSIAFIMLVQLNYAFALRIQSALSAAR